MAGGARTAPKLQSQLESLQRAEISNPPAYGAKIVSTVLKSDELKKMWLGDLLTMSQRIQSMREALYHHLIQAGQTPGIETVYWIYDELT